MRIPFLPDPRHRSPTFLLAAWFSILLLAGTVLLALPVSQRADGPGLGFLGALFTAVSAFCVTGLTLVDTHETFTLFGQAVILLLMELGGVGVMTFAALAFSVVGRRLSLAGKAALTDALFQNDPAREFKVIFTSMLKAVLIIQLIGAAVLYVVLLHFGTPAGEYRPDPLWSAVFHSVSAFCNAGFSIYRNNLEAESGNAPFLATICALVVLGGLGHGILAELYRLPRLLRQGKKRARWLSLNTRVCLTFTAILLVVGAAALALSEYMLSDRSLAGVGHAVFHSVVSRTAGFNSTPLSALPLPSCLILCILMFVGGSPGSCAGGIKTTSLALWFGRIASRLRQDKNVEIMGYSMPDDLVSKARLIIALSILWVIFGVVLLSVSQPGARLDVLLFEQISALATVGLSMGYTPQLNWFSQLWIILSMIIGKFGPLTIAMWIVHPTHAKIRRPEGRLMIG